MREVLMFISDVSNWVWNVAGYGCVLHLGMFGWLSSRSRLIERSFAVWTEFFFEVKPAIWVLYVVALPYLHHSDPRWQFILFDLILGCWWTWLMSKQRDDRWKRRRKRALAKIREVGGRLVVTPQPLPV